jgi:hypothetical protein
MGFERCQVVQMPDDSRIVVFFAVPPSAYAPRECAELVRRLQRVENSIAVAAPYPSGEPFNYP